MKQDLNNPKYAYIFIQAFYMEIFSFEIEKRISTKYRIVSAFKITEK